MNGFVFIRDKNVITGPFPRHRVREMLEGGVLGDDAEVSEDKFRWEPLSPPAEATPAPVLLESDPASFAAWPRMEEEVPPHVILVSPEVPVPNVTSVPPATRRDESPWEQDGRSHLWPLCRLICATIAWSHHAEALGRRATAVVWMAVLYCILAILGPLAYFGRAYPAWRGYLWGGAFAGVTMASAVIFAFLVMAIAGNLRSEHAPRHVFTVATMTLLTEFATFFGTIVALLHGVCHPRPWAKLVAVLAMMLVSALFAAGCRQLITGFAVPSEDRMRCRGALWVWVLWLSLIFLEFSFFALFSLGML